MSEATFFAEAPPEGGTSRRGFVLQTLRHQRVALGGLLREPRLRSRERLGETLFPEQLPQPGGIGRRRPGGGGGGGRFHER